MYIGIDAGGTKTEMCICDSKGRISFRKTFPGTSASRLGAEAAAAKLAAIISSSGIAKSAILYAGVAGAGSPAISSAIAERLRTLIPGITEITIASDAFNGLNAEVGLGDGIALIAGTGSSAFVRINGIPTQVGGRGYLIDDAGSGYWTGRACLNAAFRQLDGRGPDTQLTALAEAKLGVSLAESIPTLYENGPSFVASFAPLVFEAAAAGDIVAAEIADECARELWLHVKACMAHISNCNACPCVATGGMFKSGYLRARLSAFSNDSDIEIIYSNTPPVIGAVIAAAGSRADAEFINNLKGDLNGLR